MGVTGPTSCCGHHRIHGPPVPWLRSFLLLDVVIVGTFLTPTGVDGNSPGLGHASTFSVGSTAGEELHSQPPAPREHAPQASRAHAEHDHWPPLPPCTLPKVRGRSRLGRLDMECTAPADGLQAGSGRQGVTLFDEPRVALDASARANYRPRRRSSGLPWPTWRRVDARDAAARFGVDSPLSRAVCKAFLADRRSTFWHMWVWSRFHERTVALDCAPPPERLASWSDTS